jgi:hypothetical protein
MDARGLSIPVATEWLLIVETDTRFYSGQWVGSWSLHPADIPDIWFWVGLLAISAVSYVTFSIAVLVARRLSLHPILFLPALASAGAAPFIATAPADHLNRTASGGWDTITYDVPILTQLRSSNPVLGGLSCWGYLDPVSVGLIVLVVFAFVFGLTAAVVMVTRQLARGQAV